MECLVEIVGSMVEATEATKKVVSLDGSQNVDKQI